MNWHANAVEYFPETEGGADADGFNGMPKE